MSFKVTINHWHGVANWTWNAGDDVCGICRAPFDGNPPEAAFPGDDAPVVWGVCSHAFHIQCINKWLSSQPEQKCPFCRRPWEFKQAEAAPEAPVEAPEAPPAMIANPFPPGHPFHGNDGELGQQRRTIPPLVLSAPGEHVGPFPPGHPFHGAIHPMDYFNGLIQPTNADEPAPAAFPLLPDAPN